jgi:hypothetical protein
MQRFVDYKVIELSQFNTIKAMYMVMDMSLMGMDSIMNDMFKYTVSVNPVSYIPWLSRSGYANPYRSYPNTYYDKEKAGNSSQNIMVAVFFIFFTIYA